ncbi:MAG: alpha/beta hydrolase fold domain-containing protein [Candidatus Hydrogenedens sp.]|nr:alpha/beta hydrolase fold domain-containing protein [Candidatus Hydrogenedens sp.]
MSIRFIVVLLLAACCAAQAQKPTFTDLQYGPHERQKLDFWSADTKEPAPLVIYVHGGGFEHGDKSRATEGRNGSDVKDCLRNDVSFASINYRFLDDAPLQDIVTDTARAIQYLRSRAADLNIDKNRIGLYGESAGAGSSLWVGLHDDLADPASSDPVARESTRVAAIGALAPQSTYDFAQWPSLFGLNDNIWYLSAVYVGPRYYRLDTSKLKKPEGEETRKRLDMLALITPDDPPVFVRCYQDDTEVSTWDDMLHHPRHAEVLQERLEAAGIENVVVLKDMPKSQKSEAVDFLMQHLKAPRETTAAVR